MKIRLTTAAPNVHEIEAELARRLPQYRYAIRTGHLHRFLVVSGESLGAAIVVSHGTKLKVFGGFRDQWLQLVWHLAMYWFGAQSIAGIVAIIAYVGAFEPSGGGGWSVLALVPVVAGSEIRRRLSCRIIRNVVDCLEASWA